MFLPPKASDVLNRPESLLQFLDAAGWSDATRRPLAGDASSRQYERLARTAGKCAVLMDTGPGSEESISPFVAIAGYLNRVGLSAPEVLAVDDRNGFMLLEDFGDDIFARLIDAGPAIEPVLYEAAIDVLVHLHQAKPPGDVTEFSPEQLADFAVLAYDWYRLDPVTIPEAIAHFVAEMKRLLSLVRADPPVLALRDFHTENMVWLPQRSGVRRVGLLDFQDAFLGHPAYDLASLLQDARRDLSPILLDPLLRRYAVSTGGRLDDLGLAFAIYGAQRNLRILGVFARLCRLYGKQRYVDLIPRVWQHLLVDLSHPALQALRAIVLSDFPEPTAGFLNELKARCPTTQNP